MSEWMEFREECRQRRVTADHFVYRLYAEDGACLYVGCSMNVHTRLSSHRRKAWWHLVTRTEVDGPFVGLAAGEQAETETIERERPIHALSKQQVGQLGAAGRKRALARMGGAS